jgi:hypothetical protein
MTSSQEYEIPGEIYMILRDPDGTAVSPGSTNASLLRFGETATIGAHDGGIATPTVNQEMHA